MSRDYTLSVKDFGPIAEAHIELRPMTVFVGPSNTGKSYFATLVYALHRCLREPRKFVELGHWNTPDPDPLTTAAFGAWTAAVAESRAASGPLRVPDLPAELDEFVKPFLVTALGVGPAVERELKQCFSVRGFQELVRSPQASNGKIRLEIPRAGNRGTFGYSFSLGEDDMSAIGDMTGEGSFSSDQVDSPYTRALYRLAVRFAGAVAPLVREGTSISRELALLTDPLLNQLCWTIQSWLLHPVGAAVAHYLPSDRAGMAHTRDVVVSSLLRAASSAAPERSPLLSGVSADFLDQLVRLSVERNDQDPTTSALAQRLEEAVLEGEVRVEFPDTGYAQLWYRPKGWDKDLPLMRASSMVVELAPIVLYLRHVVRPGDLLIIDEPESHLHPGIQVEVIRQLAEVVRSGVRVILTTHSEWVLEELSNLVLASQLPEEKRRKLGREGQALTPEEVGVWLFKTDEDSAGSVVSEIRLGESNLYSSSFEEVAAGTYNDWANIADLLEGAR